MINAMSLIENIHVWFAGYVFILLEAFEFEPWPYKRKTVGLLLFGNHFVVSVQLGLNNKYE